LQVSVDAAVQKFQTRREFKLTAKEKQKACGELKKFPVAQEESDVVGGGSLL